MAKRSSKKQEPTPTIRPEAIGLVLLALALLTTLSLLSISRGSFTEGWLRLLRGLIGWGMYLAPVAMAVLGVWLLRRFASEEPQEKWEKPIGALLLFLVLLTVFHLINPGAGLEDFEEPGGGGLVGWIAGELLISAVGVAGSVVIIMALTTLGLILISGLSLAELMDMVRNAQDEVSDWRRRRALATLNHQPVSPLPDKSSRHFGGLSK